MTWGDHDSALASLMARDAQAIHAVWREVGMLETNPEALAAGPVDDATERAAAMLRDGIDPTLVRRATGLNWNAVEKLKRHARGLKRQGAKPGQGRPRSPASIEAERLLRGGMGAADVTERTGLSRAQVQRLLAAIRKEDAA